MSELREKISELREKISELRDTDVKITQQGGYFQLMQCAFLASCRKEARRGAEGHVKGRQRTLRRRWWASRLRFPTTLCVWHCRGAGSGFPRGRCSVWEKVRLLQILLASLTFNYFETQPHAPDLPQRTTPPPPTQERRRTVLFLLRPEANVRWRTWRLWGKTGSNRMFLSELPEPRQLLHFLKNYYYFYFYL